MSSNPRIQNYRNIQDSLDAAAEALNTIPQEELTPLVAWAMNFAAAILSAILATVPAEVPIMAAVEADQERRENRAANLEKRLLEKLSVPRPEGRRRRESGVSE